MTLAIVSRLLFVLALLTAPALAQGGHVFSAEKDLEGFEAAGLSEFHELYALAEFKQSDGKTLAAAELADLRARWKAEQERAQKRIALIQSDPREHWVWLFEKRLAKHPYFSKIAYTLERPEPGYLMVVQRPAKDDPQYVARLAAFYMPFVKKAAANFDEIVGQPAGLVRAQGHEVIAFAVLASQGDIDNFTRFVQDPTGYAGSSAYDYQLQLAVTYEDPFASGTSVVSQRSSLLYCVVKGLEHAYLAIPGNRPGSIWLYEGLAFNFAAHEGATPEALDQRTARAKSFEWLAGLLAKPGARDIVLMPIDELVSHRSWVDFEKAIAERTKRAQADAPEEDDVGRAYYSQSELWLHFLFDGAQGKYRKPLLDFIRLAFQGRGDEKDLRRAFGTTDFLALSREFLRWACDEYERTHPGKKAERGPIETLFGPAPGTATAAGSTSSAGEPVPSASPEFSPRELAPAEDDVEAQFALALLQAREGDPSAASKGLEALAARAPAAPWPARLERERGRLAELEKLRAGYLAYLKTNGSKLTFKVKGKDVMATVTAVENGIVRLGENRLGLPSIAIREVDPYEIAKVAAKKEQQGEAQPWSRFYAYVLAGDARWEKMLKDNSPGAKELRADGNEYPALARTALAARELYELSKLPLPREEQVAQARLERVKSFLVAYAGSGILARRIDALRQLAMSALDVQLAAKGSTALLHGKSSALEDQRVRLRYDFDEPSEAQDWVKVPGFLLEDRARMAKIPYTDKDSHFDVQKGVLHGVGSVAYRFVVPFKGPVTLRYTFRYEQIGKSYQDPSFYFQLCETSPYSYYGFVPGGSIRVEDDRHDEYRTQHPAASPRYDWDKDWSLEFRYDGKDLVASLGGSEYVRTKAGKLDAGFVGFVAHSELPIDVSEIELEGQLDPAALAQQRSGWIEQRLRELGFP